MKKVSIIVPVYNVEKYLDRCLDSLVNQTLEDIEIIVVNDASPDGSEKIMRRYESRYPEKIKCIYLKENVRLGGARNRGVECANGKYIAFVDSDDWLDITACEKMYLLAENSQSEVVFCNYQVVSENMKKKRNKAIVFPPQIGQLNMEKQKSLLFIDSCAWGKIIRKDIITDNKLSYPEHVLYEDAPATPFYYLYAERIEKVDESLYFYYERENSVTHSVNQEFQFDFSKMALEMLRRFEERGFLEQYREEIMMRFTKEFYLHPLMCSFKRFSNPPIQYFDKLRVKMKEIYPNYKENKYLDKIYEPLAVWMASCNDESAEFMVDQYQAGSKSSYQLYAEYYKKQKDKLEILKNYISDQKICAASWGAGDMGKGFVEAFDNEGTIVRSVFDKNSKIHGMILDSKQIVEGFENCEESIDLVLVINMNYYLDIRDEVKKKDNRIQLLNVDGYLKNDFRLEEWIE